MSGSATNALDLDTAETNIDEVLRRRRRRRRLRFGGILFVQVAIVVLFLVGWQYGTNSGRLNKFLFSKPSSVVQQLSKWWHDGTLTSNTVTTVRVMLTGWLIGIVVGAIMGSIIGLSNIGRLLLEPFVIFCNALPRLLLLPFFVIWLGFGTRARIVLVVLAITFIVAITLADGIREVSSDYVNQAKVLGASRRMLIKEVYVPSTILHILASSRSTVGFAFQAAVVAELIGSASGIGFLIVRGQSRLAVAEVYAGVAIVFVLGVLIDMLLALLQNRTTRWMPRG